MSLIQRLKADLLEARKNRSKEITNVLSPVIGDLQTEFLSVPRTITFDEIADSAALKVIKAHIKGAKETLTKVPDDVKANESLVVLTPYLPKQLDEETLIGVIGSFIASSDYSGKGSLMQFMKLNYIDQYNGATVAQIHDSLV